MSSHIFYCSVDQCSVSSRDSFPFFRVPKNPERCEQWKESLGFIGDHRYANLTPEEAYSRLRICSVHFEDTCFTYSGKRLLNTAVPSKGLITLKDDAREAESLESSKMYAVDKVNVSTQTDFQKNVTDMSTQTDILPLSEDVIVSLTSEASTQSQTVQEFLEDFSCQTPSHLSQGTPRKKALKRKLNDMKNELKSTKKRRSDLELAEVLKFLDDYYPQGSTMLIKNQLLLLDKASKGARYSNEFKQFSLTLYLLGPKAYKKLGKVIRLPSKATLQRITQEWKICPGLNEFIFKILELKISTMSERSKDCILCIDEMSIKSNLFYNISEDRVVGFEDLDNKQRSADIATSALVIMARGISDNWKQPVAYFFTKNSTSVEYLKEILYSSIRKLKSIGLNVLAITSDQGPNFYKLVKNYLKLTFETPFFFVDESPIFYLFDVPHLLKSTRNNFFSYIFELEDGSTNKCYLETMYHLDKLKQYRLAPRLSDEHIYPNNFKKMKVKLASQVFSHSVAVAMQTYIEFEKLPSEAKTTAYFIEKMNKLFDLFNSSNLKTCYAFTGNEKQILFLNEIEKLFENLKVVNGTGKNVTNTLKFVYGWRITISATLKLWNMLQKRGYTFLLTRHLNQDCLENYFGQIRNACGNAKNPTAIQFCRAYKKLYALKCFDPTDGGNTLEDASDVLLAITPELLQKSEFMLEKNENKTTILKVNCNDYQNLASEEGNALVYIAGYFLRKCLLKHSCDICLNFCNISQKDSSTLFCELKAYEGNKGPFGNLTIPPKHFVEYLQSLEHLLISNFNVFCMQNNVGYQLKQELCKITFIHPCPNFPFNYLLSLYTRVRIYYTLKFANREMKRQSANKENQKLKILKNL